MAATDIGAITKVTDYTVSNKRHRVRDVVLSTGANYATGGMTLTPVSVGLHKIEEAQPLGPATNGTLCFPVVYDYTNQKLKAFGTNAVPGAAVGDPEVTANTNLSAYSVRIKFSGF